MRAFRRRTIADKSARRRQEAAIRILGIDSRFDRPALDADFALLDRQLLAGCRADHEFDEIEAGNQLGHRMLDLKARVHFEEVELAIFVDDELDGPGAVIADGLGQHHGLFTHRLARGGVEER